VVFWPFTVSVAVVDVDVVDFVDDDVVVLVAELVDDEEELELLEDKVVEVVVVLDETEFVFVT
jgi:hypothetical protein